MTSQLTNIRRALAADELFLMEMLYQAIYRPPGSAPVPRSLVINPVLSRYVLLWGRPGDLGFIAEVGSEPVGAAWLRLLPGENRGYGYVNARIPELSMALLPQYRGQGIGTRLLAHLLAEADRQYAAVSLSVSQGNRAIRLYERYGFEVIDWSGESWKMIRYAAGRS